MANMANMADNVDSSKQVCSYCKNLAVKKRVNCAKCGAFFHKSCALRGSCCADKIFNEEKDDLDTEENRPLEELNVELKQENITLRMKIEKLETELSQMKDNIIGDMKTLIDKLHKDIRIIKRNIKLDRKNKNIKNNVNSSNDVDRERTLTKTQKKQTKQTGVIEDLNTGWETNRNEKTFSEIVRRQCAKLTSEQKSDQLSSQTLELKQRKVMQEVINLDRGDDTGNDYTTVTYKKRRGKSIAENDSRTPYENQLTEHYTTQEQESNIPSPLVSVLNKNKVTAGKRERQNRKFRGVGEDNNGNFKGENPKVWLFLYRVKQDVTEQDILTYLKEKTQQENTEFIVKNLKTNGNKFKEFMVAADFKFKNDFYNPSFWPIGVMFRRFDFKKYYDKYQIRDVIKGEVEENRPPSFLGQQRQTP